MATISRPRGKKAFQFFGNSIPDELMARARQMTASIVNEESLGVGGGRKQLMQVEKIQARAFENGTDAFGQFAFLPVELFSP